MRRLVLLGLLLGAGCRSALNAGSCEKDTDCPTGNYCSQVQSVTTWHRCFPIADGGPPDVSNDSQPCTTASCTGAAPICDSTTKVCRACDTGQECAAVSSATRACVSGACVECAGKNDCMSPKPACDTSTNACVECTGKNDCAAPKPACDTDTKACVECLGNPDCAVAAKPICNTNTNTCRACVSDTECPANPEVCMPDGHCAGDGEVVYAIQPTSTDCGSADGSLAKPYCAAQAALDAARAGTKRIVVLRGPFGNFSATSTPALITVVGQNATINPIGGYGLDVSGTARLLVRGLTITGGTVTTGGGVHVGGANASLTLLAVQINGNMGAGVVADGGGLITMNRCMVKGMGFGAPPALKTTASPFHVTNSVFANSNIGAVLDTPPAGGDQVFKNNDLVGNGTGIQCLTMLPATLIFSGNTTDTALGCTVPACCTGSDPMLTADYHLMSGSPCIDQLAADAQVPDDIDGDTRPIGPKNDCGADEFGP